MRSGKNDWNIVMNNRINELAKRITDNPISHDAVCAAASLSAEIKKLVAQEMFTRYKEIKYTRNNIPVEVTWTHEANGAIRVKVPGEYNDYIQAYLDDKCVWCTSGSRGPYISNVGVY
jgi:hypothetical protein